ncbi:MAG: hypothetical protein J5702_04820, partial [Bacteroidales bacterium]|nr:hypothetical protein [Bacteroidales bacterium]
DGALAVADVNGLPQHAALHGVFAGGEGALAVADVKGHHLQRMESAIDGVGNRFLTHSFRDVKVRL